MEVKKINYKLLCVDTVEPEMTLLEEYFPDNKCDCCGKEGGAWGIDNRAACYCVICLIDIYDIIVKQR
jgi:hypothetical protein